MLIFTAEEIDGTRRKKICLTRENGILVQPDTRGGTTSQRGPVSEAVLWLLKGSLCVELIHGMKGDPRTDLNVFICGKWEFVWVCLLKWAISKGILLNNHQWISRSSDHLRSLTPNTQITKWSRDVHGMVAAHLLKYNNGRRILSIVKEETTSACKSAFHQ